MDQALKKVLVIKDDNSSVVDALSDLSWLDTVFKKNGNLRFRSVFFESYYLFEDKEYFCYVKQHLKSLNSFTKVAQLPLLWQQ